MTTIRVECAWCLKNMGTKEFKEHGNDRASKVSHSICSSCYARLMNDMISKRHRKVNPFLKEPLYPHYSEEA